MPAESVTAILRKNRRYRAAHEARRSETTVRSPEPAARSVGAAQARYARRSQPRLAIASKASRSDEAATKKQATHEAWAQRARRSQPRLAIASKASRPDEAATKKNGCDRKKRSRPQLRTFLGRAGRLRCVNTRVTPERSHAHTRDRNPDLVRGGRRADESPVEPTSRRCPVRLRCTQSNDTQRAHLEQIHHSPWSIDAANQPMWNTNWVSEATRMSTSNTTSTRLVPHLTVAPRPTRPR